MLVLILMMSAFIFRQDFVGKSFNQMPQENIYNTQGIQLIMLLLGGEEQFLFQLMGHHLLEI
jgi:hypothetical protein